MSTAYLALEATFKKLNDLENSRAILQWDYATMMPSGGAEARIEQFATLESLCHDMLTDSRVGDLLNEAEEERSRLDAWQNANLTEMRRIWRHKMAVDGDLAIALTKAGSACEILWREARHKNDFKSYAPLQQEVLGIVREVAAAKGEAFGCDPYDAMIDQYDPGLRMSQIDPVFDRLRAFLPDFIQEVLDHQASHATPIPLVGTFPAEKQKAIGLHAMKAIGFDFNHGRLDISHHPFCGGIPGDVRLTTRYDESDITSALMGIEHETGHAMYENQLPEAWRHQPVGHARGMAMHESQSLLIEMQACRSWEFLSFLAPIIREELGVSGNAWEADNLYRIATNVERSFIRVDADEVTYPAHIMLRYELEKAMIAGELDIKDLPDAWNKGMKRYLGITPKDYHDGCMQDIHWTDGSFGYFPSYTMGAIIAAQLFAKVREEHHTIMRDLLHGNFTFLMGWLKTHVHGMGSRYNTQELLIEATGQAVNVELFIEHLKRRYVERH
jgi:carboxypeptidase Taq